MGLGISVVICCYNSSSRLPETIKHLTEQIINSDFPWEIIIVDNASTDNTTEVAKEWLSYPFIKAELKIIFENKPGLSYARKRGVEAATYEYIIFCDDDNFLDKNYLERAYNIIHHNPHIGAIGGQGFVVSNIELPTWFEDYKDGYAIGKQGDSSGDITKRGYIWGAGLVTRKSIFVKTITDNYPSLLIDRKGNILSSGGDSEYCSRLILQKFSLYYCEDLIFRHYIPNNRLTIDYRDRLFKSFDESQECLSKYRFAINLKNLSRYEKFRRLISVGKNYIKSILAKEHPDHFSSQTLFYLLNIGYRNNKDFNAIKYFYDLN